MSAKTIRIIVALMLLLVIALFATQVYWFTQAFNLNERQLDEKINVALRQVANNLLLQNNDSTVRIPPVVKTASNEYFVRTRTYFDMLTLDQTIRKEFEKRTITVDFDYLIVEDERNLPLLGNSVFGLNDSSLIACKTRDDIKLKLNFKVRINNATIHVVQRMAIWLYSSISLLLLVAVFIFILVAIMRGKKLADFKKDFVNNMTHELKTPIANISVASDAIRNNSSKMDEEKLHKYADIIYQENVRLHHLVDRVLQISAIEKNEESFTFETVNLHTCITQVTHSFDPVIQQKHGKITLQLNASKHHLKADKTHLTNVISNLVENAIKYAPNAPKIDISTQSSAKGITIKITDNGIGISAKNQSRIFDQFYRAEAGNIHTTKGYGLGLSYVKLIIENHGGTISFTSKPNKGTTFSVFLPF